MTSWQEFAFTGGTLVGLILLGLVFWAAARASIRAGRLRAAGGQSEAEHARNAEVAAMTRGLAHEIKNPLSTVGLNAQLLREEILDSPLSDADRERIVRRVDALAREATRLSDVLNDFLRYAGRLQLDARKVDLRDVVRELSDFFAPQAEQSGVKLDMQLPPAPVEAVIDPSLMKQVLLNLMLNAVQAMQRNESGQARTLTVSLRAGDPKPRRSGDGTGAVLRVSDTGPGVPAEIRDRIFEPYVSNRPGGNGLGLAAARRIVEAHGGRIQLLNGTPGAAGSPGTIGSPGATFDVTLPPDGARALATPASPSA